MSLLDDLFKIIDDSKADKESKQEAKDAVRKAFEEEGAE